MNTEEGFESWERLEQLARARDAGGLEDYVNSIGPSETFRALLRLEPEERELVLTTLSPEEAADLIEEIPDEYAADLIEELSIKEAASILNEMESDDQADVLSNLDPDDAEAILALMAPEEAEDARKLLPHAGDVAGGLMMTELLSYSETSAVSEVIDDLSRRAELGENRDVYAFVVSSTDRLIGTVDLRDLVLSRRSTQLADIMAHCPFVQVNASLTELDEFFQREPRSSVPVVDPHHKLLGVVRRKDVLDALSERAEHDYLKTQGIVGGDEIRTLPVVVRSRRRLSSVSGCTATKCDGPRPPRPVRRQPSRTAFS